MTTHELSRGQYAERLVKGVHRIDIWSAVDEAADRTNDNTFYRFEALSILCNRFVLLGHFTPDKVKSNANAILQREFPTRMKELEMIRSLEVAGMMVKYQRLDAPAWNVARAAATTLAELYPLPGSGVK